MTRPRPPVDASVLRRHVRSALSFSGGADSLAVLYLLRPYLPELTVYHMDTGDLLPETRAIVEHAKQFVPFFVHIQGDVQTAIARDGLPTDLLPHSAHPIGQLMAEGPKLVSRYDCCRDNLMLPLFQRVLEDRCTLLIRGTRREDMRRLPIESGQVERIADREIEMWYPLQEWTRAEVLEYLRAEGAPVSRIYDYLPNSPECGRCSAWWSEGKAGYLRRFHPAVWADYKARLRTVVDAIEGPLAYLRREMGEQLDGPHIVPGAIDAASDLAYDNGLVVLQGNRLAATDARHIAVLLSYMQPPPGSHILDIGSGFGEPARLMLEARPDLHFTCLNNSGRQLARTAEDTRIAPLLGDMQQIPLSGPARFDGAMMLYSLCHADQFLAFREAARVVKAGGFLFVYDYVRLSSDNTLSGITLAAHFYAYEDVEAAARDAGWRLDLVVPVSGNDQIWRAMFGEPSAYAAIFDHLCPCVWRFEREG